MLRITKTNTIVGEFKARRRRDTALNAEPAVVLHDSLEAEIEWAQEEPTLVTADPYDIALAARSVMDREAVARFFELGAA